MRSLWKTFHTPVETVQLSEARVESRRGKRLRQLARNDHVCRGAEDEARVHVLHARERGVLEVDLEVAPALDTECVGALVGAAAEERRDGEDAALSCAPAHRKA